MPDAAPAEGWTEVSVLVPRGWEELVADALARPPCTAVAFGPASLASEPYPADVECLRTYLPARADGPGARAAIAARLAALAEATGADELRGLAPTYRPLPPEDYATSWRKVWRPFRVGRLCVVPPGWRGATRAGDVLLRFEPRSAFGTGRHATTRTCLRALQALPLEGARVLDAGTGSGILAVAAALLGARSAAGFDVDPESEPEASALAERNGVAGRCAFRRGGFETLGDAERGLDLVIANLYAGLLRDVAAELARRLAPGGRFLFSGCAADARDATRAAIEGAGLAVEEELPRGRWRTFAGRRA